jgi:hypothetical protein
MASQGTTKKPGKRHQFAGAQEKFARIPSYATQFALPGKTMRNTIDWLRAIRECLRSLSWTLFYIGQ